MPELPDVEMIKRYFDSTSLARRIENIEVHEAGVHPKTKMSEMSEERLRKLFWAMREVMRIAVLREAGAKGFPDEWLVSHRYPAGICPRCGTELERIKLDGRTGYFCPRCQSIHSSI